VWSYGDKYVRAERRGTECEEKEQRLPSPESQPVSVRSSAVHASSSSVLGVLERVRPQSEPERRYSVDGQHYQH